MTVVMTTTQSHAEDEAEFTQTRPQIQRTETKPKKVENIQNWEGQDCLHFLSFFFFLNELLCCYLSKSTALYCFYL